MVDEPTRVSVSQPIRDIRCGYDATVFITGNRLISTKFSASNLSLYSLVSAEACNEFARPISA